MAFALVTDTTLAKAALVTDTTLASAAAQPPTANAGPAQSVDVLEAAQIGATGSNPSSNPVTYTWTKVSGPAGNLSSATVERPSYVPTASGTHVLGRVDSASGVSSVRSDVTITALVGYARYVRRLGATAIGRRTWGRERTRTAPPAPTFSASLSQSPTGTAPPAPTFSATIGA